VIATADLEVAERLKMLRQYGWRERNNSEIPGVNSRLDEFQAALLRVRLKSLDSRTRRRQEIAQEYQRAFGGILQTPVVLSGCSHVFHQYVVRSDDRDQLQQRLRQAGVATMIHYPKAVHQQTAYAGRLPLVDSLATTESQVPRILSLPMFPEMSDEMVQQVCRAVLDRCTAAL
jgi:dTDP-4-amino-4,6-dideoxygalactose transaminase